MPAFPGVPAVGAELPAVAMGGALVAGSSEPQATTNAMSTVKYRQLDVLKWTVFILNLVPC
jgi:hypothetical protein